MPWKSLMMFKTFLYHITGKIRHVLSTICLYNERLNYMNGKVNLACNLNYLFENEGLLKVTASRVRGKCGNISEMVPYRVVVTSNLLQTTNRKWTKLNKANRIKEASPFVHSSPSRSFLTFQMCFFVQLCSSWQDFNWHSAFCGLSAAELHVVYS